MLLKGRGERNRETDWSHLNERITDGGHAGFACCTHHSPCPRWQRRLADGGRAACAAPSNLKKIKLRAPGVGAQMQADGSPEGARHVQDCRLPVQGVQVDSAVKVCPY